MHPDHDGKDIEDLFREVMPAIEHQASDFESDWQAAVGRRGARRRIRPGPGSVAVLVVVVLVAAAIAVLRPVSAPPVTQLASSAPSLERVSVPESALEVEPLPIAPRRAEYRQTRRRPGKVAAPVSPWRSPTDSLLAWSGDALLKKVPRLDESVVHTRAFPLPQEPVLK
jgi:hypothetical protein